MTKLGVRPRFDAEPGVATVTAHDAHAKERLGMGQSARRAPSTASLSAVEAGVLRYLPNELTFREIAERLFVSRHEVLTNAAALYRKLGVSSRQSALRRARELGLLASPVPNVMSCHAPD